MTALSILIPLIILAVLAGMIALVIAVTVQSKAKPSVPLRGPEYGMQGQDGPTFSGPSAVGIYRYQPIADKRICRCCETENWKEASFCDTCGEPLNR